MAVRVYIGTTEGPSEIQRVTLEDAKVRSVICLGGKTIALPIARSYDSFVREPTGVIEKYFGHPAYRIDVSTPIEVGNSWQLDWIARRGIDPAQCRVVALDDVDALCRDLDLPSPGPRDRTRGEPQAPSRGFPRSVWISGATVALFAVFGLFALKSGLPDWIDQHRSARMSQLNDSLDEATASDCLSCGLFARGFRYWLDFRRPDPESISLAIFESRAPSGEPCPNETSGETRLAPVAKDAKGQLLASAVSGLCALVFEVANRGRSAHVWAFAQAVPDRTYLLADRSALNTALQPSKDTRRWSVRPPQDLAAPMRYQFVALASEDPLTVSVEWMLRKMFQNRAYPYAKDWLSVVRGLNARGITVVSVWHELTP